MLTRMFWHRRSLFPSLVVLLMISIALVAGTSMVGAVRADDDVQVVNWHPTSHISQNAAATLKQAATVASSIESIPYWGSSFTFHGQSYAYTMVGSNPAKVATATVVSTLLIPVKLVLANGAVYNGESKVNDVLNSPLFHTASFSSGNTQYGDAMQRAEFWQYVAQKNASYHVLLASPVVSPTLTIKVPSTLGGPITRPSGVVFGGIDINYLDSQIMTYMQAHHVSPRTFPIFLSANVLATENKGKTCCIGGYHSAIASASSTATTAIQTYAYASYNDPGFSLTNKKVFTTTDDLSHEISEWYNNPFTSNVVPFWSVPAEPQYGCNNYLETGDPLVGVGFDIGKYHLQDEASFSWFAHQTPSTAIHSKYSYLGTFTAPATVCTP